MSGIIANSSTNPGMVSGDTSPTNTRANFVTADRITLSATPTGTSYQWGLAIPSGSAPARSEFDDDTAASPTFVPDVAGYYVITCLVDGVTSYTMTLTVAATTVSTATGGFRMMPVTDASVPAPVLGVTLYNSSDQDGLVTKDSSDTVTPVGSGAGGGTLAPFKTYADATEREADTGLGSSDIGKVAKQVDTDELWIVVSTVPEWRLLGDVGAAALADVEEIANDGVLLAEEAATFASVNAALAAADAPISTNGETVNGRDMATDGTKLDGIEAGAQAVTFAHVNTALAAANATIDVNGQQVTTSAAPSTANSLANKTYVDAVPRTARVTTVVHSQSPYTVTSTDEDILCDSSTGTIQLNVPNPTLNRKFNVWDVGGAAATSPITLHRFAGEKIRGVVGDLTLDWNYGRWAVLSNGTDHFVSHPVGDLLTP